MQFYQSVICDVLFMAINISAPQYCVYSNLFRTALLLQPNIMILASALPFMRGLSVCFSAGMWFGVCSGSRAEIFVLGRSIQDALWPDSILKSSHLYQIAIKTPFWRQPLAILEQLVNRWTIECCAVWWEQTEVGARYMLTIHTLPNAVWISFD